MGQEITDSRFSEADFIEFRRRLDAETELLQRWLDRGLLHSARRRLGFEIEGWLIDTAGQPAPRNEALSSSFTSMPSMVSVPASCS
mgnify:CR=1 FL=1